MNQTIEGIITRFEDEFPETRQESIPKAPTHAPPPVPELGSSFSSTEVEPVFLSDTEDIETELRSPSRSRSNSIMSHTSKALAEEEGRTLRVGHKFRRGFILPEYFDLFASAEFGNDPEHSRLVEGLLDDISQEDEVIRKKVEEKGPLRTFREDKDEILQKVREKDGDSWYRFIESQEKARANVDVDSTTLVNGDKDAATKEQIADESAIAD